MPRAAVLLLCLAALTVRAEEPIPPWPYRPQEQHERLLARLETIKLTLSFTDWTLERVLRTLSGSAGVPCRADATLDPAKAQLSLQARQAVTLRRAMDLVVAGRPWHWTIHEGAVVVTREPDRYPPADPAGVRLKIEYARLFPTIHATLESVDAENRRIAGALEGRIGHPRFVYTARELVASLPHLTGLPVEVQPGLDPTGTIERPAARSVPLKAFLDDCLGAVGLGHTVHKGKLWVGSPRGVVITRSLATQSAEILSDARKARDAALARKVTLELAGKRLHQLVPLLRAALGQPVHPDERAWAETAPITLSVRDVPLREAWARIEAQLFGRVRLVAAQDGVYLIARGQERRLPPEQK